MATEKQTQLEHMYQLALAADDAYFANRTPATLLSKKACDWAFFWFAQQWRGE